MVRRLLERVQRRMWSDLSHLWRQPRLSASRTTLSALPPLVIGGTGGSGTRVFVTLCELAGMYMGRELNKSNDAMIPHREWVTKWMPKAQAASYGKRMVASQPRMVRELCNALMRHRRGIAQPDQPWGLKHPRSVLALPFLHETLPGMKFLHVVRDGRDMAFSRNQQQLRHFGEFWLEYESVVASQPIRSMKFWSKSNLAAADYGESRMAGSYLRVRFEDLCHEPSATIDTIYAFLGNAEGADTAAAHAEVKAPASIGRWQQQDADTIHRMIDAGHDALLRFGYLDSPQRNAAS